MAASTKRFTLTASYQDVSEGAASVGFRLPFVGQTPNIVRVVLGTSLPAAETNDYERFSQPEAKSSDVATAVSFTNLAPTDRVYLRAHSEAASISIVVFRL